VCMLVLVMVVMVSPLLRQVIARRGRCATG